MSIGRTEKTIVHLTEEQYARLDELEENPRCLFEGAAGTGKTLLALEYARRADRGGSKVVLVCFNRLLGEWFRNQTEDSDIAAGTWHAVARRLILSSGVASEFVGQERSALEDRRRRLAIRRVVSILRRSCVGGNGCSVRRTCSR